MPEPDPFPPVASGAPTAGAAPAPAPKDEKQRSTLRSALEWTAVIGGAVVLALVIRAFLLAAFYIPSESMVATLEKGDRVLVNKLSYKLHDVNRGDVVVFGRPPKETDTAIKDLIKRVIGLPKETVEGRDCRVFVDGRPLEEPYTDGKCTSSFNPVTLGTDEVWVMGDNRTASLDSRVFGAIKVDSIVGRAFLRIWPITRLGWL